MIAFLLRRDLFRYAVPCFWALGFLYGTVMAWAGNEDFALGYGPQNVHPAKTFMEWSVITTIMLCGCTFGSLQAFRVATPLQRALPLDARALFWSRMIITLAAMLGGSLLSCAAFVLQYEHPLHPLQISLAVNAQALLVLVPFLFHSVRVERGAGMPWYLYAPLLLGLVWLGVQLGMRSYWPAVFWLGLAVVLAVSIQRRLPRGFELASARGPSWLGDGYAAFEDSLNGLPGLGRVLGFDRLLRQARALSRGQLVLILSLTALLGLIVLMQSAWGIVLALVLVQMAWFARCVVGGGRVAHLPIARGRVFRHGVVPGLLLLAAAAVAVFAGWLEPGPTWPGLLALWAFTWWQLLSLVVSPRPKSFGEQPARLIATGTYLVLVTGVALRDDQRTQVADWVTRQSPDLLWLAAAVVWLAGLLALRRAFLRADFAPTSPETSS